MTHPATNPPEHVVAAAERQLRAHAISNELRELVERNMEEIRVMLADQAPPEGPA